jgi:hypothetical protein
MITLCAGGKIQPWWWGLPVRVEDVNVNVGTSPTKILQLDPSAVSLLVTNNGSSTVVIHTSPDVTLSRGIVIPSGWEPYVFSGTDLGPFASLEWWGIASSSSSYVTA